MSRDPRGEAAQRVGTPLFGPGRSVRRPDASMTLLIEVMERPLDPGYAAAAANRSTTPRATGPRRGLGQALILLLAVALGLGGVWAARELRAPRAVDTNARVVLEDQIRERTATGEDLQMANAEIRTEITALQESALGGNATAILQRSEQLSVWAGTTAVHGPGAVVTLEDSARALQGEPGTEDERVLDFDLQVVVNGLWASGAEAIAINGHRLTATTAIRTAGQSVLVDLQPLISPYRVEAVGDPNAMRTAFARSSAAAHLSTLSSAFSIPSTVSPADDLTLPAATAPTLRSVRQLATPGQAIGPSGGSGHGRLRDSGEGRRE